MILCVPPDFDFVTAVCSHGFFVLAPNTWDPARQRLTTAIALDEASAVLVDVRENAAGVSVQPQSQLTKVERAIVVAAVRRMLRLDEDMSAFHERCQRSETHAAAARMRFGRLLRGASLFEDIVKVICTCNTSWRQTTAMVQQLVTHWGVPDRDCFHRDCPHYGIPAVARDCPRYGIPAVARDCPRYGIPAVAGIRRRGLSLCQNPAENASACRAFPTPARLASAGIGQLRKTGRLGYRAGFVHQLARDVADGHLDLQGIEEFEGPSDELHKMLRGIRGVGDYAAGHLAMLLGRYDRLAIDTELMRHLRERHPRRRWTPASIRSHYAPWQPYQFLAYWFELWQGYADRHGRPEQWLAADTGRDITRGLRKPSMKPSLISRT